MEHNSTDIYQLYLNEVGKTPLLTRDEERAVALGLESNVRELRRLVLRSPFAVRQVRLWAELIASGELDPKELMPRGNPGPAKIRAFGGKIRNFARRLERAEKRGNVLAVSEEIDGLGLNAEKTERLLNKIRDTARRVREERPAGPLPMPREGVLALDDQIQSLEERIANAKLRMMRANLRLVVSVARRYASSHLELADLIQEGGLGLIRAIDHYRAERGFRFSTYATWWIRQAISRAVSEKERTVRVPSHVQEDIARYRRARGEGEEGPARVSEVAARLKMPKKRVERLLKAMQETVSLSTPVGEHDDGSLGDVIEDKIDPTPSKRAEQDSLREEVRRWLATLSPREESLVRMRFGIGTNEPRTLDEVGSRFHVTRERARQIQLDALKKLRESPRGSMMREYLA